MVQESLIGLRRITRGPGKSSGIVKSPKQIPMVSYVVLDDRIGSKWILGCLNKP